MKGASELATSRQSFARRRYGYALLVSGLWLAIGFATGTAMLLGPVDWLTDGVRRAGWSVQAEASLMVGAIALYVVLTLWLARRLARVVFRTVRPSVKFGIPALSVVLAATCLWLWMSPALVGQVVASDESSIASFTFGPYPDRERFERLRARGMTVISLLHPGVLPFEPVLRAQERALAAELGVPLIEAPMLPWISGNAASLALIRQLAESGSGRYYVHCYLGRDRVAIVQAHLRRILGGGEPTSVATEAARRLRQQPPFVDGAFERGPVREIDRDLWLVPYPTEQEFIAFILTGDVQHMLSLLDPDNPDDVPLIEQEERLAREHVLPYSLRPVSWIAYEPEAVLRVAREARRLPRPLLVHAFRSDVGVADAFVAAYLSDRAPLLPDVFAEAPLGSRIVQVAPHVAVGPRPDDREFGTLLVRAGVRHIAWVGPRGGGRAAYDRRVVTTETPLVWHEVAPDEAAVLRLVASDGPWYLYGPELGAIPDAIRREFAVSTVETSRTSGR